MLRGACVGQHEQALSMLPNSISVNEGQNLTTPTEQREGELLKQTRLNLSQEIIYYVAIIMLAP